MESAPFIFPEAEAEVDPYTQWVRLRGRKKATHHVAIVFDSIQFASLQLRRGTAAKSAILQEFVW